MKKLLKVVAAGLVLAGIIVTAEREKQALARPIGQIARSAKRVLGFFSTLDTNILTVNTTLTMPDSTVVTAKIATDAITAAKILNGAVTSPKINLANATALQVACIRTDKSIGYCTILTAASGVCSSCY